MTRFFGFAFSASMLPAGSIQLSKRDLTVDEVREMLPDCELCLNPFHAATVTAARERFNLPVDIPDQPARIVLGPGDSVLQPPGIVHNLLECSEDCELIEITSPAEFDTYPV